MPTPELPVRASARAQYVAYSEEARAASAPDGQPERLGRAEFSANEWIGPLAFEDFTGDGLPDLLALARGDLSGDGGPGGTPLGWLWRGERIGEAPGYRYAEPPLEFRVASSSDPNARLIDLNRDGTLDLLTIWSNLDPAAPMTRLAFYDGAKQRRFAEDGADVLEFKLPNRVIRARDPAGLCLLADFDRDGFEDVAMTHLSYLFGSVSEMVDAFLEEETEFALKIYRGGPDGLSEEPAATLKLSASVEVFSSFGMGAPVRAAGDLDGDGREELLVRRSAGVFEVWPVALDGSPQASEASARIELPPGNRRATVEPADLDGDGSDELILWDESSGSVQVLFFE